MAAEATLRRAVKRNLLAMLAIGASALPSSALADESELHTFHCLYGCPVGAPSTNDVVVREIYTMSTNDLTKMADWVAYRITTDTIAKSKATRAWKRDTWLDPDESLAPADYDGASDALHIDRGHQAPLAAFSGTPTWADTNVLSNITPQSSALNQGPWERLEAQETAAVKRGGGPIYVLTGPLHERMMRPLPGALAVHRVPSGYWKIVIAADRATGFILDQRTGRNERHCDMRAPIDEISLRARPRFFPEIDRSALKPLDAELGCVDAPPPRPVPEEIPEEIGKPLR